MEKKYQSLSRNVEEIDNKSNHHLLKFKLSHENYDEISVKSLIAQCLVTGAVMMSSASCGMPIGYSAILLPQLKGTNGTLQIDDNIGSWIASVHSAATPIGSLLSGVLMDRFGRKLSLQIATVPLVLGWLAISLAQNHAVLLAGRLLAGMSSGLTAAPGQVLIGEISSPKIRGTLTGIPFASYSFGILLVYALGFCFHWRTVAGLSTVLPVIAALCFCFLPESPVWLVRKGRYEDARNSLIWLRGNNIPQVKQEVHQLITRADNEAASTPLNTMWYRQLLLPQVLKPFIILNVFNAMQILSGTYLVVFYAVDILATIGGSDNTGNTGVDSFLAAVLTAGVRFLFTLVASVLLGFIGRRTLALTSGLGTAISALCLGTFLYLQAQCDPGYFSAICILCYVALNTIGFLILPGVLLGELYPARQRGLAGGITFAAFNVALFAAAKAFPLLKSVLGVHGVFWIFGGSSVAASVYLWAVLPETRGKTLAEIEDYFAGEKEKIGDGEKVKEESGGVKCALTEKV